MACLNCLTSDVDLCVVPPSATPQQRGCLVCGDVNPNPCQQTQPVDPSCLTYSRVDVNMCADVAIRTSFNTKFDLLELATFTFPTPCLEYEDVNPDIC